MFLLLSLEFRRMMRPLHLEKWSKEKTAWIPLVTPLGVLWGCLNAMDLVEIRSANNIRKPQFWVHMHVHLYIVQYWMRYFTTRSTCQVEIWVTFKQNPVDYSCEKLTHWNHKYACILNLFRILSNELHCIDYNCILFFSYFNDDSCGILSRIRC